MYWNFKCKIMNLVGIFLNAVDREKYQALHPKYILVFTFILFYVKYPENIILDISSTLDFLYIFFYPHLS
jgi:hypothetical protein